MGMTRSATFIALALAASLGMIWAARIIHGGEGADVSGEPERAGVRAGREAPPSVPQPLERSEQTSQPRSATTPPSVLSQPERSEQTSQQRSVTPLPQAQADNPPAGFPAQAPSLNDDGAFHVDRSVAGHAFPVSASIIAECEPVPGWRPSHACRPNRKLLEAMAEEPREEPWASAAEQAIRELLAQQPTTYTIRALECRTSLCFMEVASEMQAFSSRWYDFETKGPLTAGFSISSSETAEYGTRVYVTQLPFVRKGWGHALDRYDLDR